MTATQATRFNFFDELATPQRHYCVCANSSLKERGPENISKIKMCDDFQALLSGIFLLEVATVDYNLHFAERRDSGNFSFFFCLACGFAMFS